MSMTDMSPDDIRGRVQQVLDKARNNPQFLGQFKGDPETTLRNAGIEADLAQHIVTQELNFSGEDVRGFMRCRYTCDPYSCLATWCGYIPATS